jgi:hypothetical protein
MHIHQTVEITPTITFAKPTAFSNTKLIQHHQLPAASSTTKVSCVTLPGNAMLPTALPWSLTTTAMRSSCCYDVFIHYKHSIAPLPRLPEGLCSSKQASTSESRPATGGSTVLLEQNNR